MIMSFLFFIAAFLEIYEGFNRFDGRGVASLHFIIAALCFAVSKLIDRITKLEDRYATRI